MVYGAWSWWIAVTCSLILLSPLCLQASLASELSPPVADEKADATALRSRGSSTAVDMASPWPARPLLEGAWQDLMPDHISDVVQ